MDRLREDAPEMFEYCLREARRRDGMVAVLEFVPGVRLDCAAPLIADAGEGLLRAIGRLGALDLLLNNMDRLPLPVWRNRLGNFGNVMVTGGGTGAVGIDQQVYVIGDLAGRERYLDYVRRFLAALMGEGPEEGNFSLPGVRERLRGAFVHRCQTELPEASLELLLEGLREGVSAVCGAWSSGRLQAALDAVEQELAAECIAEVPPVTAFVCLVAQEVCAVAAGHGGEPPGA